MSDELVIRHCAPTMANIKTANLFTGNFADRQEMLDEVRSLNNRLKNKGIRVLALQYEKGRGLIYVYRPGRLSKDLQDCTACQLLKQCGYPDLNENICLQHLIQKLEGEGEFPHEIGLFLGYPPDDVEGFINRRKSWKLCGFWKVYGDVEKANKQFARFRKCTDLYQKQWLMGKSIEHLTVAG